MKLPKKKIIIISIFISILTLICILSPIINPAFHNILLKCDVINDNDSLLVHFISVGQGDGIAVNLPDGKIVIIDTGTPDKSVTFTNYLDDYVLSRDKDNKLDYVILTHADNDHAGGLLRVLQNYTIDKLFIPNIDGNSTEYLSAKEYWETNKINTEYHTHGIIIENKGYKIEFFGPLSENTTNENSPIIKLSFEGYSFLFTGDISTDVELECIKEYGNFLDCDVLKVAHHGSKYSSSMSFIETVTPKVSVISCGPNDYGHPTDTAINNILSVGSKVLRTDLDGNIAFVVNDYGLNYLTTNYIITDILDYRVYLCVIDIALIVYIVAVIIKYKKAQLTLSKVKISCN